MYVTFVYNEKGNFYISEQVIARIVEGIIKNNTSGVEFVSAEISIPKGFQIHISSIIKTESNKNLVKFNSLKLIEKIQIAIYDLLSIKPYNISLSLQKND